MVTKQNRMVIWSGVSQLDGVTPIVVLATGFADASANIKTGGMIQIAIMRGDIDPNEALKTGLDQAICGDCPQRGKASGGSGACYVQVYNAPLSSWRAHQANGSMPLDLGMFVGRKVRFGSYGDPAAVPFEVWEQIATACGNTVTGYTHQWRTADQRFSRYCMASCDTVEEYRAARKMGWRGFVVRPAGSEKPAGMITCPASAEAGKRTTCASCMQCGGTENGRTATITIEAHGASKRQFKSLPLSVA